MKNELFRLRMGIVLFVLSWFPFAQIGIAIAHNNGKLTSGHSAQTFRLVIWGIQTLVGFVALWLAGSVAIQTAKRDGWRAAPKKLWHLFRTGATE
ncbi:hypothetical protein EYC58_00055 [Candidatus Saccharibacteria bacterium]|nr:MAG: hypothetical protein EYC58_00055 [Candidatus Saccharibacteria bacterium]